MSSSEVDQIVEGNALFGSIVQNIGCVRYLSHAELPTQATFCDTSFNVQAPFDVYINAFLVYHCVSNENALRMIYLPQLMLEKKCFVIPNSSINKTIDATKQRYWG